MIDYFNGTLISKTVNTAVIEVSGTGYSISITADTSDKLPAAGTVVKLYIVESTGMYGGVISHYGFLSVQEREMFLLIKDEVPSTGAKKAMEYLDKISKALPDFQNSVVRRDTAAVSGMFGFTKKTAEKLVAALKDKISAVSVAGVHKWNSETLGNTSVAEAVAGLVALGYKEMQAVSTVNKIVAAAPDISVADIIKESLKYL